MPTTGNGRAAQPMLEGRRVRLRPWRPDDAEAVYVACQDPEIQRWTEVPVPYLREHATGYVERDAPDTWARGGALFAVEPLGGGPLIGSMALLALRDGVGVGGYWTTAEHRGQGFTGEALRLLGDWVLDDLGARRVEIAEPANTGSCRTAESAGFTREGVLRQRSIHRGRVVDDVLYSLLASDRRVISAAGTRRQAVRERDRP